MHASVWTLQAQRFGYYISGDFDPAFGGFLDTHLHTMPFVMHSAHKLWNLQWTLKPLISSLVPTAFRSSYLAKQTSLSQAARPRFQTSLTVDMQLRIRTRTACPWSSDWPDLCAEAEPRRTVWKHIYIYIYVYVYIYIYIYICLLIYLYTSLHFHARWGRRGYIYIYIYTYTYTIHINVYMYTHILYIIIYICIYTSLSLSIYIYTYIYVYIYVYVYMYIPSATVRLVEILDAAWFSTGV